MHLSVSPFHVFDQGFLTLAFRLTGMSYLDHVNNTPRASYGVNWSSIERSSLERGYLICLLPPIGLKPCSS